MKRFIWSRDALRDLERITHHFADKDPDAAERIVERIEATAGKLRKRDIGRVGRMQGVREKRVLRTCCITAYAWSEKTP